MLGAPKPSKQSDPVLLPDIKLEDLFDTKRIQVWPKYPKSIILFPILMLLLLVRLTAAIVGFLILSLLPRTSQKRNTIFKGLCRVLGLVIEVDAKHIDESARILVANHTSILDRLAVNAMVPCSTITADFQVTTVNSLSFWNDVDCRYSRDLTNEEIWSLQRSIENSSLPLLHFPEGATTNSNVGLLKFQPGVFSLTSAVQPVLIQVSLSSFMTVSPSVLGSAAWADVFWSLTLPSTHYNLKTLPSMVKLPNESAQDFSVRVQSAMASALNLTSTIYTSSDKAELSKRLLVSSRTVSASSSSNTRCRNQIDVEPVPRLQVLQKSVQQKLTMNTAAETFGKSPKERMASYHDRRALLIEAARQKYLEKHSA